MCRKIILYFIFLIFCSLTVFSLPFDYNFNDQINPDIMLAFKDGEGYIFEAKRQEYEVFHFCNIEEREDGFSYLKLFGEDYRIILGDLTGYIIGKVTDGEYSRVITNLSQVVNDANSSSYLSETINNIKIEYNPKNLRDTIMDAGYHGNYWNIGSQPKNFDRWSITYPWVEGVPGYGNGEWISVKFKREVDTISILNGYVDFHKPYLYKANNRLKKVMISSDNFNFEYFFEDKVKLYTIALPLLADEIKIEIIDVYFGNKYNDTVVTGVFSEESVEYRVENYYRAFNQKSFEEYLKHYMKYNE